MANKKLAIVGFTTTALALPLSGFAAVTLVPQPGLLDLGSALNGLFNVIWVAFAAFAVLMFVVAGFYYLIARGDGSDVKKAHQAVLWGSVGVVVGLMAFSIPFIIKMALGV